MRITLLFALLITACAPVPQAGVQKNSSALNIAESKYSNSLQNDSENINALEAKAVVLTNEGKFEEAVKIFSEVLKKDATRWRTINGIGIAFALTNRLDQAMEYFEVAAELSENNPVILNNIGLSFAFNKKYTEAANYLKKASIAATGNKEHSKKIDMNLSLVYGLMGKLKESEQLMHPHLPEASVYNNLGFYAYLKNNDQVARDYLREALEISGGKHKKAQVNLERLEK